MTVSRFSRLIRGTILSVKEANFIEVARALGQRRWKIMTSGRAEGMKNSEPLKAD